MLLIKALIYNLFKMIRKYQRDINLSLSEIYTYIYLSFLQRPFHLDLSKFIISQHYFGIRNAPNSHREIF